MTIAKGIHYPVGGNAVAVPLRCDAEGRVYLADYEPPPATPASPSGNTPSARRCT